MFRFAIVMALTLGSLWADAKVLPGFTGRVNNLSDVPLWRMKLKISGLCEARDVFGYRDECGFAEQKLSFNFNGAFNFKAMQIPSQGASNPTFSYFMSGDVGTDSPYTDSIVLMPLKHITNQWAEFKNATLLTPKPGKVKLVAPSGSTEEWIRRYGYPLYITVKVVEPGTKRKVIWDNFGSSRQSGDYIKGSNAMVGSFHFKDNKPVLSGTSATAFIGKPVDLLIRVSGAGAGTTQVASVRVRATFGKNVLQNLPPIRLGEEREYVADEYGF